MWRDVVTASAQLPFRQEHPLEAAPELRALQARGPIHRVRTAVGDEAWLVTGYAQVRKLLDGDRLGRSHRTPDTAARSRVAALIGGPIGNFETEPADHSRMRALLQPHFSPKHLRSLLPRVEALTAGLLDELAHAGPPADLHAKLALPLPILVICELLGVPYSDRGCFRSWADDAAFAADRAVSERAMIELLDYGTSLVERKRAHPDDDVISRLCASDDLTDVEVAALSMQLLFAGYETTVFQIWLTALQLLTSPDQWHALRENPALIPKAVEELLRAGFGGGVGIPRYVRDDFDIDGITMRAGDLVLLDAGAANHDPSAFADPDRIDVGRAGGTHLTFGYGSHYCVGAALARMELNAAFSQLIPRFASMRLTVDPAQLAIESDAMADGLVELPVAW